MVEKYKEALVGPMPEKEMGQEKEILARIMEIFFKTPSQLQ
jgi:hypothetical protein